MLQGENAALHREVATAILATLEPSSAIEIMWAKDIIDAQWEIQRLAIIQAELLNSDRDDRSLATTTQNTPGFPDAAPSDAYRKHSSEFDRVNRMIALAEERRNRALRELARYRERRAFKSRSEIIDAEYVETTSD